MLARVVAPLAHSVVNKVTKEILEFLVLWWIYFTLMQPGQLRFWRQRYGDNRYRRSGPQPLSPPGSDH